VGIVEPTLLVVATDRLTAGTPLSVPVRREVRDGGGGRDPDELCRR
jgi:hypothetical protein